MVTGLMLAKDRIAELGAEAVAEQAFWEHTAEFITEDGSLVFEENTFKLTVAKKPQPQP
jgi:hypothetical protein